MSRMNCAKPTKRNGCFWLLCRKCKKMKFVLFIFDGTQDSVKKYRANEFF